MAVGMAPATAWLAGCGLPAGAIAADSDGRTRLPHIYAAGDVRGAGHWEAAARQGATVAASILGVPAPAAPPAAFWSDQHGVRLQFAGTAAGHDCVEVDGDPLAGDACALFHRDGRLVGGLLVGRPRDLPALRRRLQETTLEHQRSAA
jgi:NADPH-dependent 2,4-dienoyl-CoA reductase/sulfur reductase-like enzyme